MSNRSEYSPFGIYSPYGEFGLDKSTFASTDDISGHLQNIGIPWVQEIPPFLAVKVVPADIHLYSRVGREAGMKPPLIRDPITVWNYQQELTRTITSDIGRYKYLEVDTEPDGIGGWQRDPEGYVQLLKLTHEVIKKLSPGCMLLFGGLSGGQEVLDTQGTIFLEQAMQAGARNYIDGIEFKRHHLSAKNYAGMKRHYDRIGKILAEYGMDIHEISVFVETAMYDGSPFDPFPHPLVKNLPIQTESEQAAGLVMSFVYAISIGIQKIFWNLVYERSDYEPGHAEPFPQNPFNHYGLIHNPTNSDGLSHKKLAFYSYKKLVQMLEGSDWNNLEVTQESDDIKVYKFIKDDGVIHVAWWDYFNDDTFESGKVKSMELTNLEGRVAVVTDSVPGVSSGDLVSDYSSAFKEESLAIRKGQVTLTLGQFPIYVETQLS